MNLNKTVTRDEAIAMLAQQLVSAPIFDALFADYQFARNNPISKSMETMLARLNENIDGKDRETLEKFYESVRHKASDKTTAAQKQSIVVQLYNNFFNIAFKDTVEKLGIVYTPVPCVDFISSVEWRPQKTVLQQGLTDKGVHLIDPFTGTGTFIRALLSGFIKPKDLLYNTSTRYTPTKSSCSPTTSPPSTSRRPTTTSPRRSPAGRSRTSPLTASFSPTRSSSARSR